MRIKSFVWVGLLQGVLLLLLTEGVQHQWQPLAMPEFTFPAYSILFILPMVGYLTYHLQQGLQLFKILLGVLLLLLVLGVYSGSLVLEDISKVNFSQVMGFALPMGVLMFVGLPFLQSYLSMGKIKPDYQNLYQFAWLNTQVFLIASIFTGLVWLVLALWAALFGLLKIDVFQDLFFDHYFAFPATGMMVSYGVSLGLQKFNIQAVQRIGFLFKALSLLLSLLVVLFVLALVVSGVQPLLETRFATSLLLCLQLLLVFFVNGLYQQGYAQRSESAWVRWAASLSLLAMPIFSAICVYAVGLRVAQYGWTVDRVWAAVLVGLMAIYALGYAAAVLRSFMQQGRWLSWIEPTNIVAAIAIILLMIFTHSPILSPVQVAANSQVSRLLDGRVDVMHFDYRYLRFDLGQVGLDKLSMLSKLEHHPQAEEVQKKAKQALSWEHRWGNQDAVEIKEVAQAITLFPNGQVWDESLMQYVTKHQQEWPFHACFNGDDYRCKILMVDLNQDGQDEAVAYVYQRPQVLLQKHGEIWENMGAFNHDFLSPSQALDFSKDDAIGIGEHEWLRLRVGDNYWTVLPKNP